jgi:hypothetical protein
MSFAYDVLATEEEVQKAREFPVLEPGIYDFAVMESQFKYSQAGNPMIQLKLRIIHEGQEFNVFDNLIGTKNMAWKTKHFCEVTGLENEYLNGTFNEHLCANKRGTCTVGYVGAMPKNDGSGTFYKPKNTIEDYTATTQKAAANPFAPPAAKTPKEPVKDEQFTDDTIPF